ncbi:MAG: DUF2937 family protein, partial [Pseudomonadales bacterium]|nr:DUF2937 family protein [Pseudomonadales bacterium]
YLLRASDPQIVRATWTLFEPSFALTPPGIVFALVAGVGVWLLLFALWRLCSAIVLAIRPLRSAAR